MISSHFPRPDEPITTLRDMIRAFAEAMDLIDPDVEEHHEKVAYLALQIAREMNFDYEKQQLAFYGALLHDVGAIAFSNKSLPELEHTLQLAKAGASILRDFSQTASLSEVVLTSQTSWQQLKHCSESDDPALPISDNPELPVSDDILIPQVIHLADEVALYLDYLDREDGHKDPVLNLLPEVRRHIEEKSDLEFHPAVKRAFFGMCHREIIWMDMMYRPRRFLEFIPQSRLVTIDDAMSLTEFMSRIIDFRSPFTAWHSAGVAASAVFLARKLGMDETEQKMMRIAGNLHDIGKLKIPREILEKPGRLTTEEFNLMKEHAYYSFVILKDVRGFEQIAAWAALHHEKLDGSGYPMHLGGADLPLGSRIMAVSDVFSAITEERPYRKGMTKEQALDVLRGDAEAGKLYMPIVELVEQNFDELNEQRHHASAGASRRYQEMLEAQEK